MSVSQARADINYIYDESGQLTGAVDAAGNAADYVYDAAGNVTSIVRQTAGQVAVIEFTPNSGPVGTSVTINGTGFSATASQNTVKFNGVAAVVTSASMTRLVTSVPSGATTGYITVTTPSGTATSSSVFTVGTTNAPSITSFSPTIAVSGTAVTISGSNFETAVLNNKVTFNGAAAMVASVTSTSLNTKVPANAASGHISVATPYGKAVSTGDFFIPPSPWTVADIQYTGRMTIGNSQTVTISTAGKKGLLLFDGTAGQRISLGISNSTLNASSSVSIRNLDGTTMASTFSSNVFLDTVVLPATGTYTIAINPFSLNVA